MIRRLLSVLRFAPLFAVNGPAAPAFIEGPAFNSDPDGDGWIECGVEGEFPNPDPAIGVQKVTRQDLDTLAAAVNAKAANLKWLGVRFQVGHGHDVPAVAWSRTARVGVNIEGKPAVFLKTALNDEGAKIMANHTWRCVSPGWLGRKDPEAFFHPFEFDHIGFTNRPIIKSLVVNSEGVPSASPADTGASSSAAAAGSAALPAAQETGLRPVSRGPGGAENAHPRPDPSSASAANAAPADTPWWMQLTGELAKLVEGAADAASAMQILQGKLRALYEAESRLQDLRGMISRVFPAQDGCCAPACLCDDLPKFQVALTALAANAARAAAADQVLAVNTEKLTSAEQTLAAVNTRFNQFAADTAVRLGIVAAANRQRALQCLAVNREESLTCWFPVAADAAAPAGAGADPGRVMRPALPRNPLANNAQLPSGLPAVALVDAAPDLAAVNAAVQTYQDAHPGCGYQQAHNAVWEEISRQAGRPKSTAKGS